ncbi:MAG: AAA family ATPase, partial [Longispora sp.]|nr:AAA family ATPase [Longispora sp. (in: high G+C Gram-positive bacteria)]
MLLTGARITNYRSAVDTTELVVEPDITCLVGKNESGKTAILRGMYKNNPIDPHATLDETTDFPTALSRQRRRMSPDEQIPVSRLTFQLSLNEVAAIENELGDGVMASPEFTVTVGYRNSAQVFELLADESAAVRHLRNQLDVPMSSYRNIAEADTINELYNALTAVENPPGSVAKLASMIEDWPDRQLDHKIVTQYLRPNLPRLAYFADYDAMPGVISIPSLIRRRSSGELTRGEQALLSLLTLAEIQPESFCEADQHEELVRDLEGAANAISDEVFEYWSQSDQLDVTLAVMPARDTSPAPLDEGPILQIRMRDRRHRASVPFDERSRGFVWFFSFLAYVTELERADHDMILLLDEPGLYLHGRAQQDLLRLITERLAPRHQVIFSTHSPFMIPPNAMEQVRVVTDTTGAGTTVSADVLNADSDTTAPLVSAMAAELSRSLLTGDHTLLISHPSDLIHLDILSGLLKMRGRPGLDSRWSVTPVGGAQRLATLAA